MMEPLKVNEIVQAVGGSLVMEGISSDAGEARARGVSTDSRAIEEGEVFFALVGKRADGHDFARDAFVKSGLPVVAARHLRGVPTILVDDTIEALGDLAKFYRRKLGTRTSAITGTNGKTTTKEMAASVLSTRYRVHKNRGNMNNLIGLPLSVLGISAADDLGVFEMGMSERGEIARMCEVAEPLLGVITNVGPCHLESLGSIGNVAKAKGELLDYLGPDGNAVLNFDDPVLKEMSRRTRAKVIGFAIETDAQVRAREISAGDWNVSFLLESTSVRFSVPLPGRFNVYNALAAIGVGEAFGVSPPEASRALARFVPEKQRMNRVTLGGVTIIDDSYNANPASVSCALEVLRDQSAVRRILILGNMLELGSGSDSMHGEIGRKIKEFGIDIVLTYGQSAERTLDSAQEAGLENGRGFDSKSDLVAAAKEMLKEGDVVLVKGSRGMGMEDVVRELTRELKGR